MASCILAQIPISFLDRLIATFAGFGIYKLCVRFLEKKLKVAKKISSAVIVVFAIGLVAFLGYVIISSLAYYAIDFVKAVPDIYKETKENVESWWGSFSKMLPLAFTRKIEEVCISVSGEVSTFLADKMGDGYISSFAKSVTNGIIGIIVMFLSSYMFLVDWDKLHESYSKSTLRVGSGYAHCAFGCHTVLRCRDCAYPVGDI